MGSAHSSNGGETWEDLTVVGDLPDGPQGGEDDGFGLFGGLVRLPGIDRDVLIYSNCDSEEWRENGTVWASLAAGRVGTASQGWIFCFFENTDFGPANGFVARF